MMNVAGGYTAGLNLHLYDVVTRVIHHIGFQTRSMRNYCHARVALILGVSSHILRYRGVVICFTDCCH
jgi:hypothetical protein